MVFLIPQLFHLGLQRSKPTHWIGLKSGLDLIARNKCNWCISWHGEKTLNHSNHRIFYGANYLSSMAMVQTWLFKRSITLFKIGKLSSPWSTFLLTRIICFVRLSVSLLTLLQSIMESKHMFRTSTASLELGGKAKLATIHILVTLQPKSSDDLSQ